MKKMLVAVSVGVVSALWVHAAEDSKPAQFEVQLLKAMPNDSALTLYLDWRGKFSGGFALATRYNKSVHDVDVDTLTYDPASGRIAGKVRVTINPDAYVPADKKPVTCSFEFDPKAGTYAGSFGSMASAGTVECRQLPPSSDDGIYRLLLLHGMARLAQLAGPNKGYALDMKLRFQMERGKASGVLYENVVPDYRRYSAEVESLDANLQGAAFKAKLVTVLDYGLATKLSPDALTELRWETNTFELVGHRIGDKVAGRYTATAGAMTVTDVFSGEVDRDPPPNPDGARAFLRLHRAMRSQYPVMLNLNLSRQGEIHGFAWASGYNHQPHAVDASKLKLDGNRLIGEVVVTIWPDCYKPIEEVVIRHQLDVTFDRGVATGRFQGTDNDKPFEGIVTGELTGLKPPAVTRQTLGTCQLSLHSGVKGGHAEMTLTFSQGQVDTFLVKYPQWKDPYETRLGNSDLKVEGSRLSGSVSVIVKDKAGKESEFAYRMDAMLDGDQVVGFWHGMTAGKPILNKSSKLYGKVVPTPTAAIAAPVAR